LEDGNLRAAIRLLVSDDTPAMPSAEGLEKLKEKHPPATLDVSTLPLPQSDNFLSVSETDVRKAVMSFPAGSSGGPDGINTSAGSGGTAAELAASKKMAKYADLPASYIFQPIAVETLGPVNRSVVEFVH